MKIINRLRKKIPEDAFVADEQSVAQELAYLPGWSQQASERAEEYWDQQRSEIWNHISARQTGSSQIAPRLVWVALGLTLVVATLLLFQGSSFTPSKAVQTQIDPDHELLLAVERAVQLDGPQALEPAALLAQEIGRNQQSHSTDKGNQNHED